MFVYLMTDKNRKHLHAGFTPDIRKCLEFYGNLPEKENFHQLVYMEEFDALENAKARFELFTLMPREYKNQMIETVNPEWVDLTSEILWIF